MSTNPNNCATCDHSQNPDGGHCYMFRDAPTDACMQHTGRISLAHIAKHFDLVGMSEPREDEPGEWSMGIHLKGRHPIRYFSIDIVIPPLVTCLSCGARAATAKTIPCGH